MNYKQQIKRAMDKLGQAEGNFRRTKNARKGKYWDKLANKYAGQVIKWGFKR